MASAGDRPLYHSVFLSFKGSLTPLRNGWASLTGPEPPGAVDEVLPARVCY